MNFPKKIVKNTHQKNNKSGDTTLHGHEDGPCEANPLATIGLQCHVSNRKPVNPMQAQPICCNITITENMLNRFNLSEIGY